MISSWAVLLLGVNLAATWAMVGLVWFVQVVHYPLFTLVGGSRLVEYSAANQRRTAWVVGPVMAIEAVATIMLVIDPPAALGRALPVFGLLLLVAIYACTATLQVPGHRALLEGYDERRIRALVAGNWIRTVMWSARGALGLAMVLMAIRA